jgi:MHS family proline/betaine transporter-like MFS transporter
MVAEEPQPHNIRRQVAGSVGNILEWYDFAVYGFLAPAMSPLFFPDDDKLSALINTYGIFAAGYLMRPLGGVVFGHIGDRFGRKRALQLSITMMAIPTVLIGLLPLHNQVGVLAAVLLVILRLIQGVTVGGELIGSMSYLVETTKSNRRGLAGSWSVTGAVGGILLGSLVVMIFNTALGPDVMAKWGWRLPFLCGSIIFIVGSWLRHSLSETPEFTAAKEAGEDKGNPLVQVVKEMPVRVLHMSASILLFATSFYMLFVWFPTYLKEIVKPPVEDAMTINTIAMVLLVVLIPLGGYLSDLFGRKRVMLLATGIFGVCIYPAFMVIDHSVWSQVFACQIVFAILIAMIQGPLPTFMVECFPVSNRYTAIGLSYNITLAIFGGTAPMVSTWMIKATGDIASPAIYLAVLSAISVIAMALLRPVVPQTFSAKQS